MIHFIRDLIVRHRKLVLSLVMSAPFIQNGDVQAQSAYNPYEPFTSDFRNSSRPGGFNPFDAMSNNRSQNNTFESELDQLYGGRETSTGRSRDSGRYYNAYRKYDEDFGRLYRPNQDVDKIYNERKTTRESMYLKAFREKDPKKRAALMKDFDKQEDLAALKDDEPETKSSRDSSSRRSSRSTSRSRLNPYSPARDRDRSGSTKPSSRSGGILGTDAAGRNASGSLTNRSGLLSEEIRPSSPPRGYGGLKSKEEEEKTSKDSTSRNQFLPGLPPRRP